MSALYIKLQASLKHTTSLIDVSELHGFFTGLLCFKKEVLISDWRFQLGEESEPSEESRQAVDIFQKLLDGMEKQLKSTEFEFSLLLPSDEVALKQRLQALQDWCQGFLYGVGISKARHQEFNTIEQEFINDVMTFSRGLLNDCSETEENENAYNEVVEYLRAGVFNLYEEKSAP